MMPGRRTEIYMRRSYLVAIFLTSVLFATCRAPADDNNCILGRYLSLPISFDEYGGVVVPFTIEEKAVNLLIDNGGSYSIMTEGAAARLSLQPRQAERNLITMYGGKEFSHYVKTDSLMIGDAKIRKTFVLVSDNMVPPEIDGTLGAEVLDLFDIDFDFANAKLNIFSQQHCEGQAVYWTHDAFAQVPFEYDSGVSHAIYGRQINFEVTLDGKKVTAFIDTGMSRTVMSLETAQDLFGADKITAAAAEHTYPFKTLAFPGVEVKNPDITLLSDKKSQIMGKHFLPQLILGMNVLRQLHLYIAYKEKMLYVTPASAH